MSPEDRDHAYLWDMLDSARTIKGFISGLTFTEFENDRRLQLAVERLLEIIGEAARRVSPEFQNAHAEIPWKKIIAQRNVLAHEYGEIKLERIWMLISENIGELISQLKALNID